MNRRGLLTIVVIVLVLVGAYFATPVTQFHVHFLVSQVCHGVSAGKIVFTLLFVAVFCLWAAFLQPGRLVSRGGLIGMFAGLGVGLLASMGSHLLYLARYDLPLNWHAFHWKDGFNSVTCATHIHTSKACIARALELVGLGQLHSRFDTGVVYLDAVPGWLAAVIGGVFLVSLILALRLGPRVVARYPRAEQPAVAIVLSLALVSLCKCVLDGGVLAYDAVAAAVFAVPMVLHESLLVLGRGLGRLALRAGLGVVLWLTIVAAIDVSFVVHQATHFAYRAAIYGLVLSAGFWWAQPRHPRVAGIGLTVATAVVGCVLLIAEARRYLLPLWESAPPTVLQYEWLDQPQEDGNELRFATVKQEELPPGTSYLGAYQHLGQKPNRVRNVSVGARTLGKATGLYADLIILSMKTDQLTICPSDILSIERMDPLAGFERPRFRVDVQFSAELGPVLWRGYDADRTQIDENERFAAYILLDRYLSACGVEEYILIPLAQYALQ